MSCSTMLPILLPVSIIIRTYLYIFLTVLKRGKIDHSYESWERSLYVRLETPQTLPALFVGAATQLYIYRAVVNFSFRFQQR